MTRTLLAIDELYESMLERRVNAYLQYGIGNLITESYEVMLERRV